VEGQLPKQGKEDNRFLHTVDGESNLVLKRASGDSPNYIPAATQQVTFDLQVSRWLQRLLKHRKKNHRQ
jgi:hypothetical protein